LIKNISLGLIKSKRKGTLLSGITVHKDVAYFSVYPERNANNCTVFAVDLLQDVIRWKFPIEDAAVTTFLITSEETIVSLLYIFRW
jgi:hypothetical protein